MSAAKAMGVRRRSGVVRPAGRAGAVALTAILATAVAGALAATPARAEEPPARRGFWMPGAFVSVETRSAADIIGAVSRMVDAVKPGVGQMLRGQTAQGLQIGGADALDLIGGRRPAGLLVLNPRRHEGHFVVAVGDGGLQAVFRAIGRAMNQEVDDDLLEFGDFVIGEGDTVLYFRHSAPWLLCSLAPSPLDAAARAIRKGSVPRAPARRAHVAAHLDMRELRAAYGDVVLGALVGARTLVTARGMRAQGPGGPVGQFGMGMLKEYINAGEALFQGFDELDLAVRFGDDAAEIEASALPAEDGVFGPLARVTEPATFAPAAALPEGGTFVAAWRADPRAASRLIDAAARAIVRVSLNKDVLDENDAETKEKIAYYRGLVEGFLAGEGASSVVTSAKGMSSVMAGDTPFETTRVLYQDISDIVTEDLSPLLQPMGFGMKQTYEKNVRRLPDGGRVDRATVTYEFQGAMADQMKGLFELMFGGNEQVTEIGDTGAGVVAVWDSHDTGKALDDAVARMREAEFRGNAWPSASKELVRALDGAPGVTTAAFEVRLGGYLAMTMSMMKAQPGMDVFLQFTDEEIEKLTENDIPVVGWAGADKGRLLLYERVPMAAVKNVVEFFEKMRQRVGRGGGGWEEPGPGPDDPEEIF
ncbi:MAG: hypothetical protein ACYTKD_23305 [Planctomycetota bacterium]|jgi:hypothetical protein